MKSLLGRLHFFGVLCGVSGVVQRVGGGHATLKAGAQASAFSSGNSDPVLFLISSGIAAMTIILSFSRWPQILRMLFSARIAGALFLMAIGSIIWSADPAMTFRLGVYLLLNMVACAYISLRYPPKELLEMMTFSLLILALLSFPGQVLLPKASDVAPGWTGVFPQKNALGIAMAIGICSLVSLHRRLNLMHLVTLSIFGALLVLSQSFTSVLCVGVGLSTLIFFRMEKTGRALFLTTVLGSSLLLWLIVPSVSDALFGAAGKDSSLTGRDVIWAFAIRELLRRPLLGYGFEGFWGSESDAAEQFLGWNPHQAHNGYLDIILNLGFVGLGIFLAMALSGFRRARHLMRSYNSLAGMWLLAVILMLLVHNFAEVDLLQLTLLWFVFLTAYFSGWKEQDRLEGFASIHAHADTQATRQLASVR